MKYLITLLGFLVSFSGYVQNCLEIQTTQEETEALPWVADTTLLDSFIDARL